MPSGRRSIRKKKSTHRAAHVLKGANGILVPVPHHKVRSRPKWAEELDDREWRFVEEYCVDLKAAKAAFRAGIGSNNNSAGAMASELMRRPNVAAAIDAAIASTCGGAVRTRIIDEMAAMAFHNPEDYFSFDSKGVTLKDSKGLTSEQMLSVRRVKQTKGKTPSIEMELVDKLGALQALGKAAGLGRDNEGSSGVNVQINITNDDSGLL